LVNFLKICQVRKKISSRTETYSYVKDVGGNVNKLVVKSTDGIDFTIEKNSTVNRAKEE
jgi:hypothetical protein